MKKIFLFLVVIGLFSTTANAAWYCEAYSSVAGGWGESFNKRNAKRIAMNNCRVRTPRWDRCYIDSCWRR